MSNLFRAVIVENKNVSSGHFLLVLKPLSTIKTPRPGNFFMVAVDQGLDPLLKRPFSLHRWHDNKIHLLYRVVGKGTKILSSKVPGDSLELLGPLGNTFPVKKADKVILVAGGVGIAPVFSIAEQLSKKKPLLFYGARTGTDLLCLPELASLDITPVTATDDGSHGSRGNIVNILKQRLARDPSLTANTIIYACGPEPMLKALSKVTSKHTIKTYVALEQNMACGVGTCLGCVVHTVKGQQRVCKEGPVFALDEITWQEDGSK